MAKVVSFKNLHNLVARLRDDFNTCNFILLYAYNGTGKTRLSMEFKNYPRKKDKDKRDTLYYNAFTEDLFYWDNDLEKDIDRALEFNENSKFFKGFKELALEEKIFKYLERYAEFDFKIDYENWKIYFSKRVKNPRYRPNTEELEYITLDNIKISRGEENIFVWCIFLAISELIIDGSESYKWVEYIYIDDPISSLDDNNVIALATDLSKLIQKGKDKLKIVISTHHHLFFNVMCNELRDKSCNRYFLHKNGEDGHILRATDDTPFFHHVATLSEMKEAVDSGKINTYHFNMLRSIMEKTATFFGLDDFSKCIHGIKDEALFARALNLLSHGKYSIYEPVEMGEDNKVLFKRILKAFLDKYPFYLPELLAKNKNKQIK